MFINTFYIVFKSLSGEHFVIIIKKRNRIYSILKVLVNIVFGISRILKEIGKITP